MDKQQKKYALKVCKRTLRRLIAEHERALKNWIAATERIQLETLKGAVNEQTPQPSQEAARTNDVGHQGR